MSSTLSAAAWEAMYAPYDQSIYQAVLELLKPEDVVLDIGDQLISIIERRYSVMRSSFLSNNRRPP
jgi:hypothetical protein